MRIRELACVLCCCGLATGRSAADETQAPYGFRGFEIYKLERRIGMLTARDVDGDGTKDLLVVNNTKARVDCLLRRKEPVQPKEKSGDKPVNEIADDRFYERKEVLTEKQVTSFCTGDFNGDGKADVAYFGKPAELVVAYGDGKGGFDETRSFAADDGVETPGALEAGDLNGDGRDDLVFVLKGATAVYYQSEEGTLKEPLKLPHGVKGVGAVGVHDLDGDGRKDLVAAAQANERSLRARLQEADGTLGPEVAFKTTPWRGISMDEIDPAGAGEEVLVVQFQSGLLRSLALARKPAGGGASIALGSVQIHPFEESQGGKARAMAIGDLDADGRVDVVVTEPGTAQVAAYLQGPSGRLRARQLFPSLANAESIRVADLTGDGRNEVIVLSSAEKAVGMSAFSEDGRLPIPSIVPTTGVPRAMDAGDLNGDGRADLVVAVERDKAHFALLFLQDGAGALAAPVEVALAGLKGAPEDALVADLDQDGRADLLLFDKYEFLRVWRGKEDGSFEQVSDKPNFRGGLVQKLSRGAVNLGDLDGDGKPELLAASENFARALLLDPQGGLVVKDQANGAAPSSKIKAAAALDLDGDGTAEVALFDADGNKVSVLRRGKAGVFEIAAGFPVGEFALQSLFDADLDGDGRRDLVLMGKDGFGVLYGGGVDLELKELHTFESPIRDARLGAFAVGDLNADGRPDLALLDTGNAMLEIVSYDPEKGFRHELKWRVFEQKLHETRDNDEQREPREVLVDDLDGDGKNDIAVIAHDRLLVYLQE
ncbi:MAG: FG-GAP repeat domain-containing protein [Planctomycetota bacterium]